MKILMLNNEYPPLGGGTATVNQELLLQLAGAADCEIDMVTAGLRGAPAIEDLADNIRIHRLTVSNSCIHHASNRDLLSYYFKALRYALNLTFKKRFDLVFAWCTLPAGFLALNLFWLRRIPFAVRLSGPDIPGFEERYRRIYPLLSPFIRMTWRSAAAIIAKCREEVAMATAACPGIDISIIRNGVDFKRFPPPDPSSKADTAMPLRLICVGRLIERKGQRLLFEALSDLKREGLQPVLELIGTGDSEHAYREEVIARGLQDQVRFSGYIDRENIPDHLTAADVFVLPSYNEGMSVALLEAIAAGLAVVSTETGGAEEIIQPGRNGFLIPVGDAKALAQAIKELAQSKSAVVRFGVESRKIAERLSWENVADQYRSLFRELVNEAAD